MNASGRGVRMCRRRALSIKYLQVVLIYEILHNLCIDIGLKAGMLVCRNTRISGTTAG